MKKIICLVICVAAILILTSCATNLSKSEATNLPKGEASRISWVGGGGVSDVTFEYVNESLVKIVCEDGRVLYVPNSQISRIDVK